MTPAPFALFLDTVRLWSAQARDAELAALAALVAREQARRRMAARPARDDEQHLTPPPAASHTTPAEDRHRPPLVP